MSADVMHEHDAPPVPSVPRYAHTPDDLRAAVALAETPDEAHAAVVRLSGASAEAPAPS
ncbi:hypothetical protein ACFQ2B_13145 [Streptomyces stramineus]